LVGRDVQVLIEGRSKSDPARVTGRSERHEIVHIDAPIGLELQGRLIDVRIREAFKRSLIGEPLQPWAELGPQLTAAKPARKRALRLPLMTAAR
jgi:hypothetical protein